jgi:hypothetical protein
MPDTLTLGVYRTQAEGRIQVQITHTNENGNGSGYRIAGPKHYNAGVTELLIHELDAEDAAEIRAYLDAVFPQPTNPALMELAGAFGADMAEQHASRLTGSEAHAIAEVLRMAGEEDAAEAWLWHNADGDLDNEDD